MKDELVTQSVLAKYLRVHKETIDRWALQDNIPFVRRGKKGDKYFSIPEVLEYLDKMWN